MGALTLTQVLALILVGLLLFTGGFFAAHSIGAGWTVALAIAFLTGAGGGGGAGGTAATLGAGGSINCVKISAGTIISTARISKPL